MSTDSDTGTNTADDEQRTATGPHRPKGVKQPQDHKARKKTAAQLEAEGVETTTITWRELELTIPASMEGADAEVALAFEEGKVASALRALLGPAQWVDVMKTKPKLRDLGVMFDAVAAEMGMETAGK